MSHDQCHNLSLLFRGVNYAAAASYPYDSPWSLALTCVSRACHSRFALASAPEEEKANARKVSILLHATVSCHRVHDPREHFSSNSKSDCFLSNTSSKNMTNLHH